MEPAINRAAAARANPRPTREEVLAEAGRVFPGEDASAVMAVLNEYGREPYERKRERVQRAILMLAAGDVDQLLSYTQAAKVDYRDVLWWAEYPEDAAAFRAKHFPRGWEDVQAMLARMQRPRRAPPSRSADPPHLDTA